MLFESLGQICDQPVHSLFAGRVILQRNHFFSFLGQDGGDSVGLIQAQGFAVLTKRFGPLAFSFKRHPLVGCRLKVIWIQIYRTIELGTSFGKVSLTGQQSAQLIVGFRFFEGIRFRFCPAFALFSL